MTTRFGKDSWTVQVASGWRASHHEDCSVLVGPDEIGTLLISAACKDTEVVLEDLRELASHHFEAGAQPRAAKAGDFAGFEIAYSEGSMFCRQWFLRHGQQALLVTHDCKLESRGAEDESVCLMLASLRQVTGPGEPPGTGEAWAALGNAARRPVAIRCKRRLSPLRQSERLLLVIGATAPFMAILAPNLASTQTQMRQSVFLTAGLVILCPLAFASVWRRLPFGGRVLAVLCLLLDLACLRMLVGFLCAGRF